MIQVNVAIEGPSDEGIATAILRECGAIPGLVQGKKGKPFLLSRLHSFNQAACYSPWLVLVDLDSCDKCVVEARTQYLARPESLMCLRIAVAEAEAWLLADQDAIAAFLGVAPPKIPAMPDQLADPKQALINLARRSRYKKIREGLVPREGSGASVGPTYASDIREFAETKWRPRIAAESSPSLRRCLTRVEELAAQAATLLQE